MLSSPSGAAPSGACPTEKPSPPSFARSPTPSPRPTPPEPPAPPAMPPAAPAVEPVNPCALSFRSASDSACLYLHSWVAWAVGDASTRGGEAGHDAQHTELHEELADLAQADNLQPMSNDMLYGMS